MTDNIIKTRVMLQKDWVVVVRTEGGEGRKSINQGPCS